MHKEYKTDGRSYRVGYKIRNTTKYKSRYWKKKDLGWLKDILAVLLFLLLFPYFAMSFKQQKEELLQTDQNVIRVEDKEILAEYEQLMEMPQNASYFVIWQSEGNSVKLPVEIFMVGALAASIDVTYETEVLKAQAIVLRSTLCQEYENRQEITLNEKTGNFWSDGVMQSAWGENYLPYLRKCVEAVLETQGVYLAYNGSPINGCYHGMSAGCTRSPEELSRQGEYNYLKAVDCTDNLSAPIYIQEKKIKKEKVGDLQLKEMNKEGYVISLYRDGKMLSGEGLREEMKLASSNFTWREEGDYYIFTTKGEGHGFGMDQYYGNILAKKGEGYQEILNYFFSDITYERMK